MNLPFPTNAAIGSALVKVGIAAVVVVGGLFAASYAATSWNKLVEENKTLELQRDAVLEVNSNLNNQIIAFVKDQETQEKFRGDIQQQSDEYAAGITSLEADLKKVRRERDKIKDILEKSGQIVPVVPEQEEIDITWKAYCKATHDPICTAGG